MEFEIYRTSDWGRTEKPCDSAYLAGKDRWDNCDVYKVKIESLEDLIALRDEVNEYIIIRLDDSIEIYDDYRE
jgi:hypothetical protein